MLALALLSTACTGVLNPPIPKPTAVPTIIPTPTTIVPTATPEPPQWVKNHRVTQMWSGPARDRSAISFGQTSHTFCVFRIERTEDDARVYVYNPYSDGHFWIDVEAVGPVQPPVLLRGRKPPDQNCAEAMYDDRAGTPVTATPTATPTEPATTSSTPAGTSLTPTRSTQTAPTPALAPSTSTRTPTPPLTPRTATPTR